MFALADYEAGVCDCGFHRSQTDSAHHKYALSERVCPVCAAVSVYGRIQSDRDEKTRARLGKDRPPATPDPADGRKLSAARTG